MAERKGEVQRRVFDGVGELGTRAFAPRAARMVPLGIGTESHQQLKRVQIKACPKCNRVELPLIADTVEPKLLELVRGTLQGLGRSKGIFVALDYRESQHSVL